MRYSLVLIAGAAALAACNKGPEVNVRNASVGEVAEQVREAAGSDSLVDPGRWETKVTVLEVDMPGLPPEFADRMKQAMMKSRENGYFSCLTAADVKRPKEDFFAGKNDSCRYEHFTMSGGKIDAVMRCDNKPSGTMTMSMNGTYSRDSYEATMAMDVTGGPGGKGMKMRSHSESRRVGECTADEIKARKQEVGQ